MSRTGGARGVGVSRESGTCPLEEHLGRRCQRGLRSSGGSDGRSDGRSTRTGECANGGGCGNSGAAGSVAVPLFLYLGLQRLAVVVHALNIALVGSGSCLVLEAVVGILLGESVGGTHCAKIEQKLSRL